MLVYVAVSITILCLVAFFAVLADKDDVVIILLIIIVIITLTTAIKSQSDLESADVHILRQILVENGLATYTPIVTEKRFELIKPNAEVK